MNQRFTIHNVPTPALVIDGPAVHRNQTRLIDYAATHRLSIRPHTKTHKSRRIAQLQMNHGASGLTVAKVGEAQVMRDASQELLVAYPALDPWRAEQLAQLAVGTTLRVAVDSQLAVDSLASAANRAASTIGILVDVDVGMGRTGLQSPQAALELAQHIDRSPNVRLDGIMCFPGHINTPREQQCRQLAEVSARLAEIMELWSQHGLAAAIVSGGSTPTAYQSHLVAQFTEIRPGTYIFNDLNTVRGGYCQLNDCAASIVCTVVSNAVAQQVVLDAGSKSLTSDRCAPAPDSGHGYILEYPEAKIVRLSEEHAQVDIFQCSRPPKLGERVRVIPNHICPCVNLQDHAWWRQGDDPLEPIEIEARGKIV